MIIKNDSVIVKAKRERRYLALKAKKESSDEECLTSRIKNEEYTMAVKDFKRREPVFVHKIFLLKDMNQDSAHMVAASKVPILKPAEFETWRMWIDQYISMINYALWEIIENGATLPKTQVVEGVTTEMPITTTKEKAHRRLEVKPRSTLMMGIPNEHQLKFNSIKDAKKLCKL
nr:ribonuclease H-like domain-containing protein [Tanacetum cinerariifolium]